MTETGNAQQTMTVERTYTATPERVWQLWTTKDGLESWWGPEGFTTTVDAIELAPGGQLLYTMTAVGPEQVAYMERAGMPLATQTRVTYATVDEPSSLSFITLADFIQGVDPYEVTTRVDITPSGDRVHLLITFDVMHDDFWTEMSRQGEESQLVKLDAILGS